MAVVGGGMAGLAAAKALLEQGVACTVIDAGAHGVGGRCGQLGCASQACVLVVSLRCPPLRCFFPVQGNLPPSGVGKARWVLFFSLQRGGRHKVVGACTAIRTLPAVLPPRQP